MNALFHPAAILSIGLCSAALLGAIASSTADASAPGNPLPYYGRWTVADPEAPFSSRGRDYKTVDIGPCGKDFCGVSVNDQGACGATLFRFLGKNRAAEQLQGHGKWGKVKKNVVLYTYDGDTPSDRTLQLYLGKGYDFESRSGNMPDFDASYRRVGEARCFAK